MKKYLIDKIENVLDVGCGGGLLVEELSEFGNTYGVDSSSEAIRLCEKRGLKNVRLSKAEALPFENKKFDLATALDVIEHIKDDKKAISEIRRVLKNEGLLIITVPAYKKLWSYWDRILHHKRRYEKSELRSLLEKNGFKILKLSYSSFFILLPVVIFRWFKKEEKSDFLETPNFLNPFFKILYMIESYWIKNFGFPFGLSLICVAKKR